MLPVGAGFVLNVLADGKDRPVMKRLLKPFKPAEDRFAGMEVRAARPWRLAPGFCPLSVPDHAAAGRQLPAPPCSPPPLDHAPVPACCTPHAHWHPTFPLARRPQVLRSEATGAVIIPEAASYLECTVSQRMEAGDHYIVYATVDAGKVLQDTAQVGHSWGGRGRGGGGGGWGPHGGTVPCTQDSQDGKPGEHTAVPTPPCPGARRRRTSCMWVASRCERLAAQLMLPHWFACTRCSSRTSAVPCLPLMQSVVHYRKIGTSY